MNEKDCVSSKGDIVSFRLRGNVFFSPRSFWVLSYTTKIYKAWVFPEGEHLEPVFPVC